MSAPDLRLHAASALEPKPIAELLLDSCLDPKASKDARRLTLVLRSGLELTGCALRLTPSSSSERVLVFFHRQEARPARYDATYIPLAAIEAVTVHDLVAEPLAAAPHRLALRRRASELTEVLQTRIGQKLPIELELREEADEKTRAMLAASLDVLEKALLAVSADELGQRALHSGLSKIRLSPGSESGASMKARVLSLSAGPKAIEQESLVRVLEDQL